jgi:hypothetical protein
MKRSFFLLLFPVLFCCNNAQSLRVFDDELGPPTQSSIVPKEVKDSSSWPYFLQHLPEKNAPVLDYTGRPVANQQKHFAVLTYDVGTQDLQQCADALMRLRAEYLFARKRFDEISFHFVSGEAYSFTAYCNGRLPVAKGNHVVFAAASPKAKDHASLRKYLDIVYTYASTISLSNELKNAEDFRIGTVVIKSGSPGHCFIITDEATTPTGEKVFKLVEGYTPAQSIYVLRNVDEPALGCWHRLKKGTIATASYEFTHYKLKKFE